MTNKLVPSEYTNTNNNTSVQGTHTETFSSSANVNEFSLSLINVEDNSLKLHRKYISMYDRTWIQYKLELSNLDYLFHLELEAEILVTNASFGG